MSQIIVLKKEEILNSEVDGLYTGIVSKLHYWSGVDPEKNALLQLDSKGEVKSKLSYKDLYRHSGIVASHLLREGLKAKDRVMITYPVHSVLEYLTAFVACLRIGVVPVSIYPPSNLLIDVDAKKLDQDLKKFAVFIENAQCDKAITTLEYKHFVQLSSLTKKWPSGIKKWLRMNY
jgi:acyl-CoA synthetase (AMP-forming)/AMP-acid ligase II